jgi:hypothetical protein
MAMELPANFSIRIAWANLLASAQHRKNGRAKRKKVCEKVVELAPGVWEVKVVLPRQRREVTLPVKTTQRQKENPRRGPR